MAGRLGAFRRLRKELAEIERGKEDGDVVLVPDPENLLIWRAFVRGPEDSCFAKGIYELELRATTDYPMTPPAAHFKTQIFHPNIHEKTGEVCLDVLKSEWSPAWTLASATMAIRSILAHPNPDSPLNCDAGNLLRAGKIDEFNQIVKDYLSKYAIREMPTRASLRDEVTRHDSKRPTEHVVSSTFSWLLLPIFLAAICFFLFPTSLQQH